MKTSTNPWENLVHEKGIVTSFTAMDADLKEKVYSSGSHVLLEGSGYLAHTLNNDVFFKNKSPPFFHVSKEKIRYIYLKGLIKAICLYQKNSLFVIFYLGLITIVG